MPQGRKPTAAKTVAIIGAGLSGAAVADRLLRLTDPASLRVILIDPRAAPGQGLAYSTPDPDHRLNVPHSKMSLRTDAPDDFAQWLSSPRAPALPAGSALPTGAIFAPRAVFAAYVADRLAPYLSDGRLQHLRTAVTALHSMAHTFRLDLTKGPPLDADAVVLALAHPEPAIPAPLRSLAGTPVLLTDPFAPGALATLDRDDRLLIVGSGLTSADILATLRTNGHRGPVDVLSRHGLRSMPHGPHQPETAADFATDPERTALGLLRRTRCALMQDSRLGLTWHATFDRLRSQGLDIWAALPHAERRRLLRHLRAHWDVHRFRIAPQTRAAAEDLVARGQLTYRAGRLIGVESDTGGLNLTWRPRGTRMHQTLHLDRIILATGPDHARITETHPLLRQARHAGLIAPDRLGLGLCTSPTGQAIAASGQVIPGLFIAGPLARGTVGELMGVPEVTGWAEHIAGQVAASLAPTDPHFRSL